MTLFILLFREREEAFMNMLDKVKNTVLSETAKTTSRELYDNVLGVLSMDPLAALDLIKSVKDLPSTIRDGIFFECFEIFILNLNEYDFQKKEFVEDNLKAMAIALAEVSPNEEAGYQGDPDRLNEYSKRIVKLIDDCGTVQKAFYLANISRAFAKHEIDKKLFFKLGQCIRMLTEEDLFFLSNHVSEGIISEDEDYIDDFRSLGLMYEVDAGFAYSKRAFQLSKYALNYERNISIPEKFPERNIMMAITEEDIDEIVNNNGPKWADFSNENTKQNE